MKWFSDKMKLSDFMTREELAYVQETVALAEAKTSGEIRVMIINGLNKGVKTPKEQAIHEFYRHEMDRTRDKTGILILIVLKERAVEVLADQGINEKVNPGTWDTVVRNMVLGIRQQHVSNCAAVCRAVESVGVLLATHFPCRSDDTDELPDAVIVENDPHKEG